jgi:multiple sugar transport system substrate-binding protein
MTTMSATRGIGRRTMLTLAGAAAAAPAARAAGAITLAIWTGYPELQPYYQSVADDYRKTHPNVQFSFFSTSLREAEQKLTAAVPTGTGPDIYDIGTNITVNFIDNGLLNPNPPAIDQYLKGGGWDSFITRFFTLSGKSYGLPLLEGSRGSLYYNKTMFREAGIPRPPATFPELIAAAQKLVKRNAAGRMTRSGISLRLSGQGSGVGEKFRYVLEAAGGSMLVQAPSGKWHNGYDNIAGRDALTFYVDAVQRYKIDDPKVQHDADAFVSGATAMLFREAWVIGEIQTKNPSLEYGVALIPSWKPEMPHVMMLQPWGIYVNTQSANQAAAWDFLKFLTDKQNGFRLTQMTGWISPRQDIDWKPLIAKIPQFETFLSPPKGVKFYVEPVLTAFDEIETRLSDHLSAAYVDPSLNGRPQKIAQAIHAMAVQTDQILKDARLYGTT